MALTQALPLHHNLRPVNPRPLTRDNVIALPARRLQLPVTIADPSPDRLRATLQTLLHSPLGAYVVGIETRDDTLRIQFDLARGDLGFALHTLIATLPAATVGRIRHGQTREEARRS